MSLGTTSADELVSQAIDTTAATGTILVSPAGNDPAQVTLAFPASHPKVVSVAGQTDKGRPMPNNAVATQADIVLPAQYVQVTLPGNRTSFMHGTSMASAEAAGLFANLHPDASRIADCRKQNHLIACLTRSEQ
jgi:subtilisin family serine protease